MSASIDYDTLLGHCVAHQRDILSICKPSTLTMSERIAMLDQSMHILARQLALAGITLTDNNVAVLERLRP